MNFQTINENQIKKLYQQNKEKGINKAIDGYYNKEAQKAYQALIKQKPENVLCKKQEKEIETYATDVFGSVSYAPWLKVFTACRGKFIEGWIPRDYWARIVCPTLNGPLRPFGKIKSLTQKILNSDALPDMAYFVNGSWWLSSGEKTSQAELKKFLFDDYQYVFLKKDNRSSGHGVQRIGIQDFSKLDFHQFGDFVIQAPIAPHDFFKNLRPANVPTIRINTYKASQQNAKIVQSGIRLGLQGSLSYSW